MLKQFLMLAAILAALGVAFGQVGFTEIFIKTTLVGGNTPQADSIAGRVTGGGRTRTNINGTLADTLRYLTGTEKDTSRIYEVLSSTIDFHHLADDTSAANDSADITYEVFMAPGNPIKAGLPPYAQFLTVATNTFSGQNALHWKFTTDTDDRPGFRYFYITRVGTADNKTLSAVSVVTKVSFPDPWYR